MARALVPALVLSLLAAGCGSSASSSGSGSTTRGATATGTTGRGSSSSSGGSSASTSSTTGGTSGSAGASSSGASGATSGSSGSSSSSSTGSSGGASGSSGSSGSSGTGCTNDPGCTQAGQPLCDPSGSDALGTCTLGADGCLHVAMGQPCPASDPLCPVGASACGCPAASAVPAAGAGCANPGEATCDPSGEAASCVVTGANDAGFAGCPLWQFTACTGGLVCSAGACVCAPRTDGGIYVDSLDGSDDAGATGVEFPPQCRFATLTHALSLAQAGDTVYATGSTPMYFSDQNNAAVESFPLVIPAGVTLTTTDSPLDPSHFIIEVYQPPEVSVILRDGASLSGFSLWHGSSGVGYLADGIECDGGAVSVKSVDVGGGPNPGTQNFTTCVEIDDSCQATLEKVQATGCSVDGVALRGDGGASLSASSSTFESNNYGMGMSGAGLDVLAGQATAWQSSFGQLVGVALGSAKASADLEDCFAKSGGVGVLASAGSLIIDGGEYSYNAGPGLQLTGTTVASVSNASFRFNASDAGYVVQPTGGIMISGYASLSGGNVEAWYNHGAGLSVGDPRPSVALNRLSAYGNSGDGVIVDAPTAYALQPPTVALDTPNLGGNGGYGLEIASAASVELSGYGMITGNDGGGLELSAASATLSVGVDGGATSINSNHGDGVDVPSGGGVILEGVNIDGNTGDGLSLTDVGSSTPDSVSRCQVTRNGRNGAYVLAPNATFSVDTFEGNARNGMELYRAATLTNDGFDSNGGAGLVLESSASAAIASATVAGNGADGGLGGIVFYGGSTLTAFDGVVAYQNASAQLAFIGDGGWDVSASTCAPGSSANSVWGYCGSSVGILEMGHASVTANNLAWKNATPTAGVDYQLYGGATLSLGAACGPLSGTCP